MPHQFRLLYVLLLLCSCGLGDKAPTQAAFDKGSFGYDRSFLSDHTKGLIELHNEEGARVLLSARYQGRVMTSSASGDNGRSYGWINYALIGAGQWNRQFNPVGGEERFWVGPEGGQYSFYFRPGDSFTISRWQVPAVIDTAAYNLEAASDTAARFTKMATLTNYSGTNFHFTIEREIRLMDRSQLEKRLGLPLRQDLKLVGYSSSTSITNRGPEQWSKQKGLMSVWLLGMMTPSPGTKVMLPFRPVGNARSFITDDYFGKIPSDRLKVNDSVVYLRCDGRYRGKVGLSPKIARTVVGSMDFDHNVLTLICFSTDTSGDYVNAKWELQQEPYRGDAVNAYNDGSLKDGSQLGPFYEIESSSPAKALVAGAHMEYNQVTCHIQGSYENLKQLARQLLGTDLDDLKKW